MSTAVVGGGGELRSLKQRVSRGQCFDSKGKEVENQYPTKVLGERRGMCVCAETECTGDCSTTAMFTKHLFYTRAKCLSVTNTSYNNHCELTANPS